MTDIDGFDKFLRKVHEVLYLHFRHYMPVGKPEPMIYRDLFYELYKVYDSGVMEDLSQEPVLEEEVKQLDLLAEFFAEQSANLSENYGGTLFESEQVKKT